MDTAADYVVEVRDRDFARLGQIAPEFLDLKFVEVFNSVGAWELRLPAEHPLLPALKTKGAGLIVTHVPSGRVFSGRMTEPVLSQDAEDPEGTWVISGVDDNVVAATRAVFPDPANLASAQAVGYWVAAGPGETVMKNAVRLNAGSTAIASRKYAWLTVAADAGRGLAVNASARFDKLGDLLSSLGTRAGLGWRFFQSGAGVTFEVFPTSDKSDLVRLDIRNGGLSATELGYSAPTATTALVLGQGEGADRTVRVVTSAAAAAEAALWGLTWEVTKDQRNTDVAAELDQAGQEILTEQGSTVYSLKVTPSDAPNQRLGVDWGLGDLISVVIDGAQAEAVVTEVATSISSAGVIRQATVGDPVGFDWEAKVGTKLKEHGERISDLERMVDTGGAASSVDWVDVTSKPATFPPSAHTHAWSEVTGKPATFAPASHTHPTSEVVGLRDEVDQRHTPLGLTVEPTKWTGPLGTRLVIPTHVSPPGGQTTHPSVVYVPEGWNGYRFWMGHTPYPTGNDDHEDPNIAVSNDGITWVAAPGVTQPLDDQDGTPEYNSDVNLVMGPNNTMYCFWRFYDSGLATLQEKMYYRSSTDGVNWGPKTLVWQYTQTALRPLSPSFTWDGTKWTVYAVDLTNESAPKLVRMTSSGASPLGWSAATTCTITGMPAGLAAWHVEIRQVYGQWVGLLNANVAGSGGVGGVLLLITSRDGLAWASSSMSVIPQVYAGEHNNLYKATFVPEAINGVLGLRVWYSAFDNTGTVVWNVYRTWVCADAITHFERGSGTLAVGIPADTDVAVTVTFARPFTDVPEVNVSTNSSRLSTAITAVSATGFTFRVANWSPVNPGVGVAYRWNASLPKF